MMIKKLLFTLCFIATTFVYSQSASLIDPPTTVTQNQLLTLSGNYDVGTGHTVQGSGVTFLLREYDTNNSTFLWKASAVADEVTIGTQSGVATTSSVRIPSDLALSSELASGVEYRLYISFQNEEESPAYTSAYQTITVTNGYRFDFEGSETVTIGKQGNDARIAVAEVANPVTDGINTTATCVQVTEESNSFGWERLLLSGFTAISMASEGNYISVKFISPKASGNIYLKVNHGASGNIYEQTLAYTGTANVWQEKEFYLPFIGDPADTEVSITRIDISFDPSTNNTAQEIYYVDQIDVYNETVLSTSPVAIETEGLLVYPNPTTGVINISDLSDVNVITVSNVMGQVVKNFSAKNAIDISDLPAGMYVLQTDNGLKRKVVKK
ncbi:T9SS type A sorting domain-containing protein [Flavicella sediminum]|uniref:T9SS type A sorting domain-containing protein n=1 Tax=Flavicella sediminum TaxID=2585141 RepID=UPI0011208959|nr:T9SS type A sorting domain-containing protein [Flavicella sediminum]